MKVAHFRARLNSNAVSLLPNLIKRTRSHKPVKAVASGSKDSPSIFETRESQERIYAQLERHRQAGHNVLVEYDCGRGKRVLQYILTQRYPTESFVIILNSSASFSDTLRFFQALKVPDLGYFGPGTKAGLRPWIYRKARIVLTTPQALNNTMNTLAQRGQWVPKDVVIINEVDAIVRRTATQRTLIMPYNRLLPRFASAWLIGLSATLRDWHVALEPKHIGLRADLATITAELRNVALIPMAGLVDSEDLRTNPQTSYLAAVPVEEPQLEALINELSTVIKEAGDAILTQVQEEGDGEVLQAPEEDWQRLLPHLPVEQTLADRYGRLTLIRKFVLGMPPRKAAYYLRKPMVEEVLRVETKGLPAVSPKVTILPELIGGTAKTVILCTYVATAETIRKHLKQTMGVAVITGRVREKQEIIQQFRESKEQAVLVLTGVGERDLDLPEASLLILYDTINTTKTMYQRLKRSRDGQVKALYHANTPEKAKVEYLFKRIAERYPWSIEVQDN